MCVVILNLLRRKYFPVLPNDSKEVFIQTLMNLLHEGIQLEKARKCLIYAM